ncbi:uncharacterized protein [Elaeis guineensis]|uniref:uncharacterized protein n=1 Tax=Elaeis guineensis var. tenera TaxID=51953 RepID=UPI00057B189D
MHCSGLKGLMNVDISYSFDTSRLVTMHGLWSSFCLLFTLSDKYWLGIRWLIHFFTANFIYVMVEFHNVMVAYSWLFLLGCNIHNLLTNCLKYSYFLIADKRMSATLLVLYHTMIQQSFNGGTASYRRLNFSYSSLLSPRYNYDQLLIWDFGLMWTSIFQYGSILRGVLLECNMYYVLYWDV